MFINKLNQLYKPKRILYYQEASKEQTDAFYKGVIPEKIAAHSGAFGTYDLPGFFYIRGLEKEVIGIEYRLDDERADYPTDLESVILDEAFFYSVELDEEINADRTFINELFAQIARDDDAHRVYTDLNITGEPSVISVFTGYKKIRILYEAKVYSDRADYIIHDDTEHFDKQFLYKAAYMDFITGHFTWNHLVAFLEMPLNAGIRDYAFAHFDIKQFRVINETFGHIAANKVLCNVVDAMNRADFVYASARCHNDNFAMIIKDMPEDEMIRTLEDFFEGLSRLEEDENYRIYYRCGVVPMQRSMLSGNRVADAGKMAQALGTGRAGTQITVYTDKMHGDISWGNYIKGYVETAIKEDEFVVYFQPKYDIKTEKVKGAEALIRWNYKKREFLPPSKFIPFFERDGTIGEIDDVVLRKVCRAMARWKDAGIPLHPVSVNLSRERLYEEDLINHLVGIVDESGIPHELIDFELTESATYENTEHMLGVLKQLREKGFQISLDDFGTGYSSLSLLTRMPIDTLKIDKSFVDPVSTADEREEDITVLRHIITLAKELGFVTLAEGAESKAQVDRLRELGCEVIQGYYYSRPVPENEYEKLCKC
ncbi:MAG: EAL domain-containing protein [Lachnospiraceae bacterium]|nr:EAL domain-containing protein [Lachnospiraceae bacterium]